MIFDAEKLYELLPAVYRVRDAKLAKDPEIGGPLKQFVTVLAEQAEILEENVHQLYDDQFIETCAEWVVPYIGDLIGARVIYQPSTDDDIRFSQRAQVANTLATRRRKGVAAILEQLARDVTNWDARAVEFFQLLGTTQHMNHIRPENLTTPDLRQWQPLEDLNTPFTTSMRNVEVRRIASKRGKYNIPNVGIFLWRLGAYRLTRADAFRVDDRRYLFNPLGINTPLHNLPLPEDTITGLAQPINVPTPISRRRLHYFKDQYYGRSIEIFIDGSNTAIPSNQIVSCNLADANGAWAHAPDDHVGVDPVLGRIAFPANQPVPQDVRVSFYYASPNAIGGGEYDRSDDVGGTPDAVVTTAADLQTELNNLSATGGVVEIPNSRTFDWNPASITLNAQQSIELRASNQRRPVLDLSGNLTIQGGNNAELVLNGLVIQGGTVRIQGNIGTVRIQHCTFVPGIRRNLDGTPQEAARPSLVVASTDANIFIESSVLGGVRVAEGSVMNLRNSIIDANELDNIAYSAPGAANTRNAGGEVSIDDSTIRGTLNTFQMTRVSNSLLVARSPDGEAPIQAERRQVGCVRYSYLSPGAIVPQRYNCLPTSATDAGVIRPIFTSARYGDPAYFQLHTRCPEAIKTGSDDEAEMGVYHDLYQSRRETNLRIRMEEYLRFGLEAGLFYVT